MSASNHIMVDLETLGVEDDAIILSIGACVFDPLTGAIGEQFHILLDPYSQPGRVVDVSTALWWMKQSEDAKRIFDNTDGNTRYPLTDALRKFTEFVEDFGGENVNMWAWGILFDLGILIHAYKNAAQKPQRAPWSFRNVCCTRTLANLIGSIHLGVERVGTFHNALDDAIFQAKWVHAALAKMGALGRLHNFREDLEAMFEKSESLHEELTEAKAAP